ncbi:MAG: phytoene/squalene synthase family protein [Candidatus Diapherotrites archaeon]|nr:phytoene/squalene synthase family protein [Candidatus Diapherotrites archaeon]MDZ4256719.1 phytoene/squalene synthase family protein [archaeon]
MRRQMYSITSPQSVPLTESLSSFAIAAESFPLDIRRAATAVHLFCRATDDIVDGKMDPSSKKNKLQEWEKDLHHGWENNSASHPILSAFVNTCREYWIPQTDGFALIEGLRRDLTCHRYATFESLHHYCAAAGGIPGRMMARLVGAPLASMSAAVALGIGMQLTNILRDIQEDFEIGRVYLPHEDIKSFGYTEEELAAGKITPAFQELMRFQVARARSFYVPAREAKYSIPRHARMGTFLCGALYEGILDEIEQRGYDVFSSRVRVSDSRMRQICQEQKTILPGHP